ncbi:hypothetical protein V8E55_011422 [Tylopilus felleus]
MYVFSAGFSGMTASFSIDSGTAVPNSIQAPPPPAYQISNVSLYDIQGIPTGNHTMKMTLLDWGTGGTSMKFDYAYINETFVASPTTTSSTPSMTSSASRTPSQTPSTGNSTASNSVNVGGIVGATLGGLAFLVGLVIGLLYWRRRKATRQNFSSSEPNLQPSPFTSEFGNPTPAYVHQNPFSPQRREEIAPRIRSAVLRDALAAGNYPSGPDYTSQSGHTSSGVLQPLRRPPSQAENVDIHAPSSASYVADSSSPFSDSQVTSRYNLTVEQGEVIKRLQRDNVPLETVARVIEGFVSSNFATGGGLDRKRSVLSAVPPPSYQTRDGS